MRHAGPADAPAVRTLLARAYEADPLLAWLFPDPATRLAATAAWLAPYVERYTTLPGRVLVAEASDGVGEGGAPVPLGAALWRQPDDVFGAMTAIPGPGDVLAALLGPDRAQAVADAMAVERDARPSGPHAVLHFLAVDAARRGTGVGRALVEACVAAAAAPVLLETTNPDNLAFYARVGFYVVAQVRLGDGPTLWVLTR